MVQIPAGEYRLGSESFYPEESPVRSIQVAAFSLDVAPVTNADFARFVADTGYVTVSEKPPDPELYPNLAPEEQCPESAVFIPPPPTVDRSQPLSWWALVEGADVGLDRGSAVTVKTIGPRRYSAYGGQIDKVTIQI